MSENLKAASQDIKEIISKFNLSSTEVELIFINLRKEMELKEFTKETHNEFSKAIQRYYFSNCSNCSDSQL